MKVYGNLDLNENEVHDFVFQLETTTPNTTKAGRLLFRNKRLFIASEITGVPVWVPLTTEISTHVHTQGAGSTTWSITHNLNTTAPNVTVWDSTNNVIIPNEITVTNANTVTITFSSNQTGRAIILEGYASGDVSAFLSVSGFETLVMNTDSTNGSTTFTDDTSNHTLTAIGDAQHSTTSAKFGATSALFDGTGDYISVSDTSLTDIGLSNEPFNVECWINVSNDGPNIGIIGKGGGQSAWNSTTGHYWLINRFSGTTFQFAWWNGSLNQLQGVVAITTGQWYHLVVSYDGSIVRMFLDGSVIATSAAGRTFAKPSAATIMNIGSTGAPERFNGYIDSVRIEKNYARYTSAFTPPTAPFPV